MSVSKYVFENKEMTILWVSPNYSKAFFSVFFLENLPYSVLSFAWKKVSSSKNMSNSAKTLMHNWHFLALFGYYLVINSVKTFGHNLAKKLCSSYISDLKINHGWRRWRRKNIQIGESCAGQSLRYKPLILIRPKVL